jgi:hypothetical protein
MNRARCLDVPYVSMGPDPTTVVTRLPTGPDDRGQDTYLESTLTPDEAEGYGFALMLDARRARAAKRGRS